MEEKEIKKNTKSYCEHCDYNTNHSVLKEVNINGGDEYHCSTDYMIVRCKGCDRISFRQVYTDFEQAYVDEYDNWHPEVSILTFPKKEIPDRFQYDWYLPEKIKTVYSESIKAYNAGCFLLSGVGFRAVIEAVCLDKGIKGRDLGKKIDNLTKQKLITENESKRLHSIRFIGNDSVHEMSVPKRTKLDVVLNIVNHLLGNLYIIDREIEDNLETVITGYTDFENLLNSSVAELSIGDELPLTKILGKSIRRLNGKINDFESELMLKIKQGEYAKISIGKNEIFGLGTQKVQHFIVNV